MKVKLLKKIIPRQKHLLYNHWLNLSMLDFSHLLRQKILVIYKDDHYSYIYLLHIKENLINISFCLLKYNYLFRNDEKLLRVIMNHGHNLNFKDRHKLIKYRSLIRLILLLILCFLLLIFLSFIFQYILLGLSKIF